MPARRTLSHLRALRGEPERVPPILGGGLGSPEPPVWMDGEAQAEWRRVTRACEPYPLWLQQADVAALTAYCVAWSMFLTAAKDVAERGPLVEGRSSADQARAAPLVRNPAVQVARDAQESLRRWARELGFTPDARGRVDVGSREAERSRADDLLTGGR